MAQSHRPIAVAVGLALAGFMCPASSSRAQRGDSAIAPALLRGAFVGFIKSSANGGPVRSADVRLFFMDSARVVRDSGAPSLETFVDTVRSRLAVSDSSGYFAMWRVAPGRYLMSVRRIGYSPAEMIVTIDTSTVLYDFAMTPLTPLLAQIEIKAAAPNRLATRLDRTGFSSRKHFEDGQFLTAAQLMTRQPQTLRDILDTYSLRETAEYVFDRMPLDYYDIESYPAELIAGIEVYRHGRPIEFNMTRRGPNLLDQGGGANIMRPLVVIWTYLP